jgi:plastocyanin
MHAAYGLRRLRHGFCRDFAHAGVTRWHGVGNTEIDIGRVSEVAHVPEPDIQTEVRDQAQFDEAVNRTGKHVLEWLAGAGILAAVVMSAVALIQSGQRNQPAAAAQAPVALAAAPAPAAVQTLETKIAPGWKQGPDGKKHDAFTQTEFAVKVGDTVRLRVDNTDEGEHSITAPQLGVNILIKPGVHTYSFVVHRAGRFQWFCLVPCDDDSHGWAMRNSGFMSGYITAS